MERSTPLLGIVKQGKITTLVAYGSVGDTVELNFLLIGSLASFKNNGVNQRGHLLRWNSPVMANAIEGTSFQFAGHTYRVEAMKTEASDHAWFVDNNLILGPDYVGEASMVGDRLRVTTEYKKSPFIVGMLYGPGSLRDTPLWPTPTPALMPPAPALTDWQTRTANFEASPYFPDNTWKANADPLPMGADGDTGAYAWYHSTLRVPRDGTYTLRFTDGGDWASVFVGGKHIADGTIKAGVPLTLTAGTYPLAVLTAHYGRPKLFGYLGPLDTIDAKGLRGPVILDAGTASGTALTNWRVLADAGTDTIAPPIDTTGAGWADGTTGPDIFGGRQGYAWYVATLPTTAGPQSRLRFENVDDNALVFLNGKQIAAHEGWGQPFAVPLDSLRGGGPNVLAVRVQNTGGGGGIQGAVTLQTVKPGDETPVTGWKMHGGIAEPGTLTGWQSGAVPPADGAPAFYRAMFTAKPPAATGPHPILRVTTTGLSHGFIWLNGHNLGRYPEKLAVNGLYLPEPWLRAGQNEVVIFDEQAKTPAGVTLTVEQAASRFVVPMREK